ncbi:dTDP-4-dehydrorhamnose reductase [Xanthomonas arboricola pv. juglandis]|uniref:dTDP-4-dehydrorhamnose reductase n=2 Tax=Xanthomonas arboricola TaxID=56448 RepID=UPI00063E7C11|nr:dTDP-4-dehydrorhamnose reductase [Xanthomonas arboricola]MDN0219949.1 dTDP-4-dehydrorhamnose reductase [Xanthomonas arboricola pv. juglandis]MDN0224516.1 dTDP-4-dehydrorhamnose reductase [Xanthomonas arboricola pv. juglandis]MDN0228576.1 dTDP-4-dehydrorhamnose reductase [Xanthomonas arboricola pv. juglandis]MDN0232717.1 dTDP-4-dehydrorhamnose reductase [Xanthomonas arboricola pv. juglandis]MDN0237476.1 dTDP-4-dehydrorhamnose reductase [Xanthomonas arboricola pv. juglandis]
MTTLVFGANGQVGTELLRALAADGAVQATTRSGQLPDGSACETADFDAPQTLASLLDRIGPSRVVNAAAYTAVDRAEQDRDGALRANATSPGVIAAWCASNDVPLVHYSTDYVFDGQGTAPYPEDAQTSPLGVYGETKLAGEEAIRASGAQHLILRTAWVYASHGANFLRTMLRVGAERDELRVVADQVGTPTPAALIADVTAQLLRQRTPDTSGTWHLTAAGQTSWHGFAEAIFQQAVSAGLLSRAPRVVPITTADYPTPAKRPAYSRLSIDKLQRDFDIVLPDWQLGLQRVIAEIAAARE